MFRECSSRHYSCHHFEGYEKGIVDVLQTFPRVALESVHSSINPRGAAPSIPALLDLCSPCPGFLAGGAIER
jgi:hypothetical protein